MDESETACMANQQFLKFWPCRNRDGMPPPTQQQIEPAGSTEVGCNQHLSNDNNSISLSAIGFILRLNTQPRFELTTVVSIVGRQIRQLVEVHVDDLERVVGNHAHGRLQKACVRQCGLCALPIDDSVVEV